MLLQVRDAGNLLTRAELALPTVDVDTFAMRYTSPLGLVTHLRRMAESSSLARPRPSGLSRDTALAAAAAYASMQRDDDDDGVTATYQV